MSSSYELFENDFEQWLKVHGVQYVPRQAPASVLIDLPVLKASIMQIADDLATAHEKALTDLRRDMNKALDAGVELAEIEEMTLNPERWRIASHM